MLKDTLKSIIVTQHEWLAPEKNEIPRVQLKQIGKLNPFSYILTGVRRSGKSTLLKQIMRQYKSQNYFNFEDSRAAGFELSDFLKVEEIFTELYGRHNMIFFDEIQNVQQWEKYVRSAVDRKKIIVITGSNAKLLSKELGTKLTGRHLDYEVFPFSYKEFLSYFKLKANAASSLRYINEGGFPGYLLAGRKELLSSLVNDVLVSDIFTRYNLRNQETYKRIVQYLLSNTGKEISYNNLKNVFDIASATSVMEFLHYLTDAYLIFLIPQYHTSLKVQARNPRKVYAIDQGLAGFSNVSGSPDKGRMLENTLFLNLKSRFREIYYFKGKKECDFICRLEDKNYSAIQVTWQLVQENENREIEGLLEAMSELRLAEGSIVTFDQEDVMKIKGKTIRIIPGYKWMI